jgi:hypothetical protein
MIDDYPARSPSRTRADESRCGGQRQRIGPARARDEDEFSRPDVG